MADEIRIDVKAEGADQAARELERVQQSANGGQRISVPNRLSLEDLERKQRAGETEKGDVDRQAYVSTRLEATQARAGGDEAGAKELEREAEVIKRTAYLQKELNTSRKDAEKLARQTVEAEEQIAAAKKRQAAEERQALEDLARKRAEKEEYIAYIKLQQRADEKQARQQAAAEERQARQEAAAEAKQAAEDKKRQAAEEAQASAASAKMGKIAAGGVVAGLAVEHTLDSLRADFDNVSIAGMGRSEKFWDQNKANLIKTLRVKTPAEREDVREDLYRQLKETREQMNKQVDNPNRYVTQGTGIGTVIGGAIGTIFGPGIGTMVGAAIGSALGAGGGALYGRSGLAPEDPAAQARRQLEVHMKELQNQLRGLDSATDPALRGMARFRAQAKREWDAMYQEARSVHMSGKDATRFADEKMSWGYRRMFAGGVNAQSGGGDIAALAKLAGAWHSPEQTIVKAIKEHSHRQMSELNKPQLPEHSRP